MNVLIAGGGRTGTQLASLLNAQGHDVRVIEHRKDILAHLHHELPTEIIYEGNPTDPQVLESADISNTQVVAACTTSDADNLIVCFMARALYKVPRTIARINNPRNAWLFNENFHVDCPLNQADIMSSLIEEEMSLGDMMTLLKLRHGQYSLIEEKIPPGARAVGVAIKDLSMPDNVVIAAIIRHGKMVLPRGLTSFESGDEVLAITDRQGADFLAALFTPQKG
ncbi:MAG TPA: NAD-binding protein [Anaerolineales bacterium]|nr:NAD-binding protein [Anaerolineales bacterium]